MIDGQSDLPRCTVRRLDLMATPIETRTVRVWRCKCEHGYVRCSRDVNHQGDICSDCTPPRVHVNGYHTTALESTPSVDADYPPAPLAHVGHRSNGRCLDCG